MAASRLYVLARERQQKDATGGLLIAEIQQNSVDALDAPALRDSHHVRKISVLQQALRSVTGQPLPAPRQGLFISVYRQQPSPFAQPLQYRLRMSSRAQSPIEISARRHDPHQLDHLLKHDGPMHGL